MYRNFLTHQFALSFDRICHLHLRDSQVYERLKSAARKMAEDFGQSTRCADEQERARWIDSAADQLEVCRKTLEEAAGWTTELREKYAILSLRFTKLLKERPPTPPEQIKLLG